jgi:ABC-type sugar transport system permease subunit
VSTKAEMRRDWAWGAFGAVIAVNVVLAGLLVAWAVSRDEHGRLEEERAIALARSLAYVAREGPASDVQRYIDTTRDALGDKLVEAYYLSTGEVNRFGLSTGNEYRANLDRTLVGQNPQLLIENPRQKEIFDRTERVLGAGEANLRALAEAPLEGSPTAVPYLRIVCDRRDSGAALTNVSVPVVGVDGELHGVAGVTVAELAPGRTVPWPLLLLTMVVAAVAFFFVAAGQTRRPPLRWVLMGLMGTLMLLVAIALVGWEEGAYQEHVRAYGAEASAWLGTATSLSDEGVVDYALRNYRDARVYDLPALPFAPETAQRDASAGFAFGVTYLLLGGLLLGLAGFTVRTFRHFAKSPWPYFYIVPSMIGMIVLVFGPFFFGVGLAFHERDAGRFVFVGLNHFFKILGGQRSGAVTFYWTLFVTLLWTFMNVVIHVAVGLALALILNDKLLRFKKFYRVVLILPWAIPNYITALIWRGLFDTTDGAVNQFLGIFGIGQIDWLGGSFLSAFSANLITNSWLGFPFMMVVSLGALQSIPGELYEAADVDGATRWQKFRTITLPLLKPALFPAIILGSIWTFNMFNIIYLVSGGGPGQQTEILITEAYKAFYNRGQWGFAAAYSVMIFLILLLFSSVMNRVSRATEGAFD